MIKENGIAGDEAADGGGVMSKNIGRRRIWFWVLALAFLAVSICLLLQVLFHLFNGPLNDLRDYLSTANGIIYSRMALGISVGTVIVLAVLLVFPILIHNINTRSYFKGLYRGVISAAIFYFSKSLYAYLSSFSQLYMLLSMLVVVVITFMLIQAVFIGGAPATAAPTKASMATGGVMPERITLYTRNRWTPTGSRPPALTRAGAMVTARKR